MTAKRTLYPLVPPRDQLLGKMGYVVTVEARDEEVFKAAARDPALRGLHGAALAAALLEKSGPGDIRGITYEKNGVKEDGPNGLPAVRHFNASGACVVTAHYRSGEYHDGPKGEPALENKARGHWIARYRHGKLHNGPNGEPAEWYAGVEAVTDYGVMTLGDSDHVFVTYYRDGERVNGPDGAPAAALYKKGVLQEAWRIGADKKKESLSPRDLRALQKSHSLPSPGL